jgi:hypothetical protein
MITLCNLKLCHLTFKLNLSLQSFPTETEWQESLVQISKPAEVKKKFKSYTPLKI